MVKVFTRPLVLVTLLVLTACGGNGGNPGNPGPPPSGEAPRPILTSPGTPVGAPVTQIIGPAGGTLQTADGRMQLTFPTGALGAETTLTLQPVTHALPGGVGLAYELRPPGVALAQPLQIRLRPGAGDLAGAGDDLGLALQDDSGAWYSLGGAQLAPAGLASAPVGSVTGLLRRLNRGTRLIQAIGVYARLHLTPAGATVRRGQSLKLNLAACDPRPPAVPPAPGEDDLAPIGCGVPNRAASRLSASAGQLGQNSPGTLHYTAPGQIPSPNPVTLTVTYDAAAGRARVILLGSVRVVDGLQRYAGRVSYRTTSPDAPVVVGTADLTYDLAEDLPGEARYVQSGGTFAFTFNPNVPGLTCPTRDFTLAARTGLGRDGGQVVQTREASGKGQTHVLSVLSAVQDTEFTCRDGDGHAVEVPARVSVGLFADADRPVTDEAVLEASEVPMSGGLAVASWRLQGE